MLQLTSCLSGASPIKPARSHERSESAASLRVAERPDAFVRSPYASPSPSTLPLAHVSPPSASDPAAEASADAASSSAALRVGRCVGAVVSAAVTLSACAAPAAATPPVVGLTELSTPVAAASLTGIEHSAMVDSSASAALAPNAGRSEAATREAQPDVLNLGRPVADQEHDYLTVSGRAQWMKSPPPWGDLGNPTSPVVDVGVSSSGARVRMQTYENGSLLYRVERDPRDDWVGALPPSATDAYIRHGGPAYYGTLNGGPYSRQHRCTVRPARASSSITVAGICTRTATRTVSSSTCAISRSIPRTIRSVARRARWGFPSLTSTGSKRGFVRILRADISCTISTRQRSRSIDRSSRDTTKKSTAAEGCSSSLRLLRDASRVSCSVYAWPSLSAAASRR